jgi:hypothetical protein
MGAVCCKSVCTDKLNESSQAHDTPKKLSKNKNKIPKSLQTMSGMTLRQYVVKAFGEEGEKCFSKSVDLDKIRIICLLG